MEGKEQIVPMRPKDLTSSTAATEEQRLISFWSWIDYLQNLFPKFLLKVETCSPNFYKKNKSTKI